MNILPEPIVNFACHTGEAPLWHPDEGVVYWVDIPRAKLYRHAPDTGKTDTFDTGAPVGAFTIHEDGRLLLFMAEGAVRLWHEGEMETVLDGLPEEKGNRFNDVIADPEGRVFCGVMSTPDRAGRLYRFDPDRRVTVIQNDTGTANGMGFSPDLKTLYFCDSGQCRMYAYDYDRATGGITNRRVVVEPGPDEGKTDGMTVDTAGNLWSARWDGSRLVHHAPDGRVLQTIPFPVKKVSCVTFGGPDYTDMYITTAGGQDPAENGELAGALFHLNLGIQGKPEFRSKLNS